MKSLKNVLGKPTQESHPWANWIWNKTISGPRAINQFNALVQNGFGGIIIRPGKAMSPSFLSDEFFEFVTSICTLAAEKNIQIRIADSFCATQRSAFGLAVNHTKQFRAQQLVLEQSIVPSVHEDLTLHIDDPDTALILAAKFVDHQINIAETKTLSVKPDKNTLVWKAVQEEWRILVFRKQYVYGHHNEFLPNLFSTKASQAYIQQVLDPLKTHFQQFIPATFCGTLLELPFNRPGDNALPWDDDLAAKFKSHSKKDLIKLLPALFFENCPLSQKIRLHFYEFLFKSIHEQFVAPIEAWSKKNHLSTWILYPEKNHSRNTNELIGETLSLSGEGGTIGIQNLDGIYENRAQLRLFADSNNLERNQEIITILGRNRTGLSGSLQSLKAEFDLNTVSCQSTTIFDGYYFNVDPLTTLKTSMNPAWYSPEWHHTAALCSYVSRVRELVRNLKWSRQAVVLSPLSEMISDYFPNNNEYTKKGFTVFQKTIEILDRLSISYDCVSDEFLTECTIDENGGLCSAAKNRSSYHAIVIPYAPLISKTVLAFIEKAIPKGVLVFFIDEAPKGTIEDGITPAITGRILKLFDPKKPHVSVVKSDSPDSDLAAIETPFFAIVNSRRDSDIVVTHGSGEGYELYVMHNTSEQKDLQMQITFPAHKHLTLVNCETGEFSEVEHVEKEGDVVHLELNFLPKETFFLLGSGTKIATQPYTGNAKTSVNPFTLPHRSYRIVLKDQWTFTTQSQNALPLGNWNLRIGMSRESGSFSQFYESSFQVNNLPRNCTLVLNDPSIVQLCNSTNDNGIELSVNGTKIDRQVDAAFSSAEQPAATSAQPHVLADINLTEIFTDQRVLYAVTPYLVKGNNRISIRTTGKACNPQSMYLPPFLLGDFAIVKDKTGIVLDNTTCIAGYGSWTKYGYPYLSGKGVYSQIFEVPNEYEKIILRFSQVSGSLQIRLNENDLGIFNWHPFEIDITKFCQQKQNAIEISVLNGIDNLIRMNGHASGLIGEVFLDVY